MTSRRFVLCLVAVFALSLLSPRAADTISTLAGTGTAGFAGDGGLAASAQLHYVWAVFDNGSTFIADTKNSRIRIISSGIINTQAGSDSSGFEGDGGPATAARIKSPEGVVADSAGNVFIADTSNHRIRVVNTAGVIATLAGTGSAGFSGDGGLANAAQLSSPKGLAVDLAGNLLIADTGNNRIRSINLSTGIIGTLAGSSSGFAGDGGPVSGAKLNSPADVTVAPDGSIYIADTDNNRIRMIDKNGKITTQAGKSSGYGGDGGASLDAKFRLPTGVAVDAVGNIYIADTGNNRVRRVDPSGIVTTIAGTGVAGFSGDGGGAALAQLDSPTDVSLTSAGLLLIADRDNDAVRVMLPTNNPTITSPLSVETFVGDTISYTVTGTGFPYPKFTAGPLPEGLKFDGKKITGQVKSASTTQIMLTASNGVGPDDVQILTLVFKDSAVVITSSLAKKAQVGQFFTYTVQTTGRKPVTISVDSLPPGLLFNGDDTISGTPSRAGPYTTTMVAVNSIGTDAKTLALEVHGTISTEDSDADGFPNEIENALGTSTSKADDKPFPVLLSAPLGGARLSIKLNFAKNGSDGLTLNGMLPIPENFQAVNQSITIDVGGSMHTFALNSKGAYKDGQHSFSMRIKSQQGFIPAQIAKFTLRVAHADLQGELADEGIFNRFALSEPEPVPIYVLFNQTLFSATQLQLYSAHEDKSGRTTQPR